MRGKYPELALMFAIPNGGHRHKAVAKKLKAEGVMPGVPDIFLACPKGAYHGLFIELKAAKGYATENQKLWLEKLYKAGYGAVICKGRDEAIAVIEKYLSLEGDQLL